MPRGACGACAGWRAAVLAPLLAAALGCDDAPVGPSLAFPLEGRYVGSVQAMTESAALDAVVTFVIESHVEGTVSGVFAIEGSVDYGATAADIIGSGTFSGTATDDEEPMLFLNAQVPFCSDYRAPFAGTFTPATGRLVLGGALDILEGDCTVLLRFEVFMHLAQLLGP